MYPFVRRSFVLYFNDPTFYTRKSHNYYSLIGDCSTTDKVNDSLYLLDKGVSVWLLLKVVPKGKNKVKMLVTTLYSQVPTYTEGRRGGSVTFGTVTLYFPQHYRYTGVTKT